MSAPRYTPYQQIDKKKWDACIDNAGNGLIYAYSIYLDAMSEHWDALVLNDYESVMPLTFNKKYGIHYLYQPFFTACLGVFGNHITATTVDAFLSAIPKKFKYWDIYLNHGNYVQSANFNLYERLNFILDLNKPYDVLYNGYRDNIKRNIKKSVQLNCVTKTNIPVGDIIVLAREQSQQFSPVNEKAYSRFSELYKQLQQQGKAVTYGIYSGAQLVASCVFFLSNQRAYYILVGNHPNGKTIGASHALIDAFIKDHAGKNILLDFEGSDVRNVAFFYESFGATVEKYVGIRLNRLPAWLKWLKR